MPLPTRLRKTWRISGLLALALLGHAQAADTAAEYEQGEQTFYAGTIQIAAGLTQVSRASQDRAVHGSTEANRNELVLGLTNLSSGIETIYRGRELMAHANALSSRKREIAFEPERAGAAGKRLLTEMERVTEISAETLASHVNSDDNIYALAAEAKGMAAGADDLSTAAETALAKAGRLPNPEVAVGLRLADLMRDLAPPLAPPPAEEARAPASPPAPAPAAAPEATPAAAPAQEAAAQPQTAEQEEPGLFERISRWYRGLR